MFIGFLVYYILPSSVLRASLEQNSVQVMAEYALSFKVIARHLIKMSRYIGGLVLLYSNCIPSNQYHPRVLVWLIRQVVPMVFLCGQGLAQ